MSSNSNASTSGLCHLPPHLRLRDRIGDIVVVEGTPRRSGIITWIFQQDGETKSHIMLKDNGRIIGATLLGGPANGTWHEWNPSNYTSPTFLV